MASRSILIGVKHVTGSVDVICGPEVPIHEQNERYSKIRDLSCHEIYAEVQQFHLMLPDKSIRLSPIVKREPATAAIPQAQPAPEVPQGDTQTRKGLRK